MLIEYLYNSAKENPEKIFLKSPTKRITFREAFNRVKNIGAKLPINGNNCPVIVFIDREIESIINMLGVLYTGGFYIPVDYSQPVQRIKIMLEVSHAKICISHVELSDKIKHLLNDRGIMTIYSCNIDQSSDQSKCVNLPKKSIKSQTDLVYGMFTSGTTGVPKLVVVNELAVFQFIETFSKTFNFSHNNCMLSHASFDFDLSIKDIYLSLKNSCTLYVLPKSFILFPKKIVEVLSEEPINTLIWSVAMYRFIYQYDLLKDFCSQPKLLMSFFSGEEMPVNIYEYWKKYFPTTQFINCYGPTEVTSNCTYYRVPHNFTSPIIPIGKNFTNSYVYLIDEDNKVIRTKNKLGEILVRGPSIAVGYYYNSDKTNESFIQTPYIEGYRDISYRTGDLAYYDENFDLVYQGRIDNQIKINGHRIELLELESSLRKMNFIKDACCVFNKEQNMLIMFYISDSEVNESLIVSFLSDQFPKYMIPTKYCRLKEFPLTARLKVDRRTLLDISVDL